jgi:hypothetical protein
MQYLHDNLWMHIVSCYRFVDGGALTNATFKLGHTIITMGRWNINFLWKQKGFKVNKLIK